MKVLILGASGYIGQRLAHTLGDMGGMEVVGAARGRRSSSSAKATLRVDSCDLSALTSALTQFDCIVNCVAGDFNSIANGARTLVSAAIAAKCPKIIHLSSMAVYGRTEGLLKEDAPFDPQSGWYARAKCEAENHMKDFVSRGGEVVILRPGCVFGPGCELWVGRVARWLRAGRIGDLGVAGDGWSNLVHLDDVCEAVLAATQLPAPQCNGTAYNLAAPDGPRWNDYLVDLAIAIDATPVRRLSARRLKIDSLAFGPPLKIAEIILDRAKIAHPWLPEPLPPSVLRLWPQGIRLDGHAATHQLGIEWRRYSQCSTEFPEWAASCRQSS